MFPIAKCMCSYALEQRHFSKVKPHTHTHFVLVVALKCLLLGQFIDLPLHDTEPFIIEPFHTAVSYTPFLYS